MLRANGHPNPGATRRPGCMGKATATRAPLIFMTALFVTATVTPASANVLETLHSIMREDLKQNAAIKKLKLEQLKMKSLRMQNWKKESAQLCKSGFC